MQSVSMSHTIDKAPTKLTSREAAAIVRRNQSTILRWIRQGLLPAARLPGRRVLIELSDLERLVTPK